MTCLDVTYLSIVLYFKFVIVTIISGSCLMIALQEAWKSELQ